MSTLISIVMLAAAAIGQPDIEGRLDDTVKRAGLGQFWGAVLVARDGEVLLSRGYGFANEDLHQITSTSLFDVGSISKMFTAACILRLADQGALHLDDSIDQYFQVETDITIRHLLTHTSGKSDMNGAIQALSYPNRDGAVRAFAASTPNARPGERFEYCNGGYVVLAAVIEKASGMSFEDCVRAQVLEPAGMTRSGFLDGDGLDETMQTIRVTGANGASARRGLLLDKRVEPWAWGLRGAGGLVTCLDDLLAFDQAIREGSLLSEAAMRTWLTPELAGFACGWHIDTTDDGRAKHSHGGSTRGYICELRRYPDEGVVIAVLSNEMGRHVCPPGWIADQLADVLWPPPVLDTKLRIDFSRETLGRYSEVMHEQGVELDVERQDGSTLMRVSVDQRLLVEITMNDAAATRLHVQLTRTLAGRDPAPGGVKLGMFGYQYRTRLQNAGVLTIEACDISIMPSYAGVDETGNRMLDPRLVLTFADREMPGGWPVMIHLDDQAARRIVDALRLPSD